MVQALVVIPARYGSVRLPGKPLLKETGKFLIQYVVEAARRARHSADVIVATDDCRIVEAVESFGGKAVMTSAKHPSGTDRVAEAAKPFDYPIVVNVQGDEPQIQPAQIDSLIEALANDPGAVMATLAVPVTGKDIYTDPNAVKVVMDGSGRALYFSRAPIPFSRDGSFDEVKFHKHIGIYAYRRDFLMELAGMPPGKLEQIEKLEQLRVLESGREIRVVMTDFEPRGIDSRKDYEAFMKAMRGK